MGSVGDGDGASTSWVLGDGDDGRWEGKVVFRGVLREVEALAGAAVAPGGGGPLLYDGRPRVLKAPQGAREGRRRDEAPRDDDDRPRRRVPRSAVVRRRRRGEGRGVSGEELAEVPRRPGRVLPQQKVRPRVDVLEVPGEPFVVVRVVREGRRRRRKGHRHVLGRRQGRPPRRRRRRPARKVVLVSGVAQGPREDGLRQVVLLLLLRRRAFYRRRRSSR
mmetsp:Transcript_7769/g.25505  ORF Transcript_7769/g.25505 Transcript_7769/m.25505 type:complete len:219 (-) Transcript_7769:282-938(-)